ncbi:MAG: phosphohistidine phosphatase SixA [Leptolyngbyaceae cyanobacterium CRU_2_3]|nr:phosphohistidine phosphatase SixA [Leptolyngbyaceae cyanobacterium CRU_2_3]
MGELYLIRHGIAGEHGTYANDDERPLTEEGRSKTKQVAKRLYELGIRFDLIQTSPLVRAQQTAEILQAAKLSNTLEVVNDLAPGGDFENWTQGLQQWQQQGGKKLAIVGHEPNLGTWAERLVWGEVRHRLVVKKAGIIGLLLPQKDSPVGNSQLFLV